MPRSTHRVRAAAIVFLLALALYASSAAPGLLWGDAAELQGAARSLGIPHATGYPTFVLLGALFSRLGFADPAFGINFMSAFFGALTLAFLVLALGELEVGVGASVGAAAVFGLTFTPWHSALHAEVYALAIALGAIAGWASLVAHRTQRLAHLALAAFLLGVAVTGHFAFALPFAIVGLSLAWKTYRAGPRPLPRLALLAGAFVLGFAPYLQTWSADVHRTPFNYFDLVQVVHGPDGHPLPGLETPLRRIFWLMTGRNQYPAHRLALSPTTVLIGLIEAGFSLFVFELGPVAFVFALAGLARLRRRAQPRALRLMLVIVVSVAFAAITAGPELIALFLLPAMLSIVFFVGAGLDALRERLPRGAAGVALVLAVAAMVLPGNALRIYADAHPFTRWKFHVESEGGGRNDRAWIPSMRGENDAARYGTRALELVPHRALVLADWSELMVLRYFTIVEGRRPDLDVEPLPALPELLRLWRERGAPARPLVCTGSPEAWGLTASPAESLDVEEGRRLYVFPAGSFDSAGR